MLSSDDFSEKLVGYLGVSVLLNEEHEVIPMVIQSMQNDMDSRIPLVRGAHCSPFHLLIFVDRARSHLSTRLL